MIRFDMIPTSLNSPKFNLTWKTSEKLRTEETSPDYKKNVTITCPVEVADRESLFWDYLINVAVSERVNFFISFSVNCQKKKNIII